MHLQLSADLQPQSQDCSWHLLFHPCLLYTSDAADEEDSVDLGGGRIIKKKIKKKKVKQ